MADSTVSLNDAAANQGSFARNISVNDEATKAGNISSAMGTALVHGV